MFFKLLFAVRVAHVTSFALLFLVTSIHSIQKIPKITSSETRRKVMQKIQLFKAKNIEKSIWQAETPDKKIEKVLLRRRTDWYTLWK